MQSFLHTTCKSNMCEDCVNIAEEYQELEHNRKMALMKAIEDREGMSRKLKNALNSAEMYKSVAHAGIGEIIAAWIDKEINALLS